MLFLLSTLPPKRRTVSSAQTPTCVPAFSPLFSSNLQTFISTILSGIGRYRNRSNLYVGPSYSAGQTERHVSKTIFRTKKKSKRLTGLRHAIICHLLHSTHLQLVLLLHPRIPPLPPRSLSNPQPPSSLPSLPPPLLTQSPTLPL